MVIIKYKQNNKEIEKNVSAGSKLNSTMNKLMDKNIPFEVIN